MKARNPNHNANLKPAQKGEVRNPNGRPPKAINIVKKMPKSAQADTYAVLFAATQFNTIGEAIEYLSKESATKKYGIVLELAIRELSGKNGWQALNDILDRLYGKAKQVEQTNVSIKDGNAITIRYRHDDGQGDSD